MTLFIHRLAARVLLILAITVFGGAQAGRAAEAESAYGKQSSSEGALIGMFYDLKQNQQRVRSEITTARYSQIIDEFLKSGWDETVLNRFYRASRPLYTTQLFSPSISAGDGPKAFGVEKIVDPNYYLVHYKGQVVAPKAGVYRFLGYGDNVFNVAVDGKTVLVANRKDIPLTFKWTPTGTGTMAYPDAALIAGDWIKLDAGQTIDFEALLGESSGGISAFFLLIQEQGATYADDGHGNPILPIFQLAPYETPPPQHGQNAPKFARESAVWKCLQ